MSRPKGTPKTGGRRPGTPNKVMGSGMLLKDMILKALDKVGGINYLAKVAQTHPQAFMSLIGKVLPVQLTGNDGKDLSIQVVKFSDIPHTEAPMLTGPVQDAEYQAVDTQQPSDGSRTTDAPIDTAGHTDGHASERMGVGSSTSGIEDNCDRDSDMLETGDFTRTPAQESMDAAPHVTH